MKKPMVKLNDGTSVQLEEFINWGTRKQNNKTMPLKEFEEKKAKRVEALKRAVNTPFGQFSTFKEAVEKTKISSRTLLSLLKNTACPEYNYVNPKPSDLAKEFYLPLKKQNSKKTVTPLGVFDSIAIAAEAHNVTRNDFYKLLKTASEKYYLEESGPKKNPIESRNKLLYGRRSIITPKGEFPSVTAASIALKLWRTQLTRFLQNPLYPEFRYSDSKPIVSAKKIHRKSK